MEFKLHITAVLVSSVSHRPLSKAVIFFFSPSYLVKELQVPIRDCQKPCVWQPCNTKTFISVSHMKAAEVYSASTFPSTLMGQGSTQHHQKRAHVWQEEGWTCGLRGQKPHSANNLIRAQSWERTNTISRRLTLERTQQTFGAIKQLALCLLSTAWNMWTLCKMLLVFAGAAPTLSGRTGLRFIPIWHSLSKDA